MINRYRRGGFTLMEILVVIGILMLLMGIGVAGYRYLDRQASDKATRVTLANANALVAELAATGAGNRLEGPAGVGLHTTGATLTYGGVNIGATDRATAISNSQSALTLLASIPKNKSAISQLPVKALVTGAQPPALADAWGNPIVFVPSGGLTGVTVGGTVMTAPLQSPDKKGFWASAGADGSFSGGDDNVYSFEK
jgi:type II secretory pathway pseudopilin PulG